MESSITEKYRKELDIKISKQDQIALNLSGGNQQKVVLSKWLCSNASILILDEPTRGIDVKAKQEIYKLIDDLTRNNVSIIIISSDLPELISISDRILIMHEGKIKGEVTVTNNLTQEDLLRMAIA